MTEAETRKAVRRAFLKFYRQWPAFGEDSDERAFAEWQALTPEERGAAATMLPAFLAFEAMNGRTVRFAASTYLREQRWTGLPEGLEGAGGSVIAATFGKAWMAERFARLGAPCERMPPLTRFQELEIAEGRADRKALWRERMSKMGWPAVNAMNEQALRSPGKGMRVSGEIALLATDFEAVRVGGGNWTEWQAEHERRGWPWLPETGWQEWVYFPRLDGGTPADVLSVFFEKLDGLRQREAAE
ncbi:hypothetical protein [Martelella endophytica]|uniref:Uncharacterized protein n=1 Tax=Martelella endophytica TaxID=1486262 RepID=A0A0D5LS81_MAREN|nr:hypothetical protein [Martelella endophytica]AJY47054.1 hypothetical protein TM49_17425 [Martelella endophytica]